MDGPAWATILQGLSEKKSSIEAATAHALGQPENAPQLFAAVVARMQVKLAPHLPFCPPSLLAL